MPSFPCAATRDLARYHHEMDEYDAIESFANLHDLTIDAAVTALAEDCEDVDGDDEKGYY